MVMENVKWIDLSCPVCMMTENISHLVCHADEFLVSEGGLKSTHTGNTRGPPGVWKADGL